MVAGSMGKNRKGTTKLNATMNFAQKVEIHALRTSLFLFALSDSSDTKTPIASENASATAIVRIPHMTTIFIWLPVLSPTISHKVVMMPEVIQKVIHVLTDCFIYFVS